MFKFLFHFKNRNFLRLFSAQTISQFGDRVHQMALIGLISAIEPGSAMGIAKILAFTIIPVFIIGPVASVYVDRWDRRKTLFVCDLARGALVLTIPFIFLGWNSLIPIYTIVFFIFCFSRFYVPAKMAIIPDLVEEDNLIKANSLVTVTGMIAFVCGALFGGMIVENLGVKNGFIWDAATFFASGLLVFSISRDFRYRFNKEKIIHDTKEMIETVPKTVWEEIRDAFRYLKNHKEIRFIVNIFFILLAAAGAVYTVIIVFIQETFGSVTRDLGVLAPFLGVGLFLGSILYGRYGQKISRYKTIFSSLIVGGIMLILFASLIHQFPNRIVAISLTFLLGLIIGPIFIASNTVVHLVCDEEMRGRVFGGLEIVIHFAFLVSMFISSWISGFVSNYWILIAVGVIFAFVGILGFFKMKTDTDLAKS